MDLGQNTTINGWEVIVTDGGGIDPLNQNITIGVKKIINGVLIGNYVYISPELLDSLGCSFKTFVHKTAIELIDEAEEMNTGTTGDTYPRTYGNLVGTWTGTAGTTGGTWVVNAPQWQYSNPTKYGDYQFPSIDVSITTNKESDMGRAKQSMHVFKMIAVDVVSHEILADGTVFARSVNSANIKFALENKIDPDRIGDEVDFFITYQAQLGEPEEVGKVQKVQVVE